MKIWNTFYKRNLLRKMDLAYNVVPMSSKELARSSSAELQNVADKAVTGPSKNLVIQVPEVACEFPNIATKKSQVFPLPLSYENQCTIMGTANNLSLFSEEFNFPCEPTEKYNPLKNNKSDLSGAYERFAFLKALSKHKEKQKKYEDFLRRKEKEVTENEDSDEIIVGIVDSNDSDSSFDDE